MSLTSPHGKWKVVLLGLAFALGATTPLWGLKMISKGSGKGGREAPINVTAERMEVDHVSHRIIFSGNVVAVRGSMIIRSEFLEVVKTGSGKGADEVSKIIARDNVRFEDGMKRATGDEAIYLTQEGKVVLTGSVRAWDEESVVTGHQMTLYIDEDKSVVIGSNYQRVEVTLKPREDERRLLHASGKNNGIASRGRESPIYVTADRMEADHSQKTVFFEGRVVTRQADFRMDSDELEVFDSGQDDRKISKIVARGSVRIDRAGKIATGDKAVYYERERKILLSGNARAWEDKNVVTGSRMEIYIDEDKSVVLGDGTEQVKVTIYPQDSEVSKQPLPLPTLTDGSAKAPYRP